MWCFCGPSQSIDHWNKYVTDLAIDYLRSLAEDVAINMLLHDIKSILKQQELSCSQIGLPNPNGFISEMHLYDPITDGRDDDERIRLLNDKQLDAFQRIISDIDNQIVENSCFYLDGHVGSRKILIT